MVKKQNKKLNFSVPWFPGGSPYKMTESKSNQNIIKLDWALESSGEIIRKFRFLGPTPAYGIRIFVSGTRILHLKKDSLSDSHLASPTPIFRNKYFPYTLNSDKLKH